MSDGLKVFISHAVDDSRLAEAWQELIETVTLGQVVPWYSSDKRFSEGIRFGEAWRQTVLVKVNEANTILLIVTPGSNERPWLVWESGIAQGQDSMIIPVRYFMKETQVHDVFQPRRIVDGESEDEVFRLCEELVQAHFPGDVPKATKDSWRPSISRYHEVVKEERRNSLGRTLFHRHFHNSEIAESLEGIWYAKWTELHDDGTEDIFEVDTLEVWTTESRLRIVGTSSKKGLEQLSEKAREAATNYPMEGVVSEDRRVALCYWSAGAIPFCGTTLLERRGNTGELLEGTWEGFTARHINDERKYTRGRVVMGRDQKTVESYWQEVVAPGS